MQRTYHLESSSRTALPPALAQLLSHRGRKRRFAAGSWIQQRGDDGNGFWLVQSGRVALCRHGVEGDQTIFAILGAGDLFGELAYFAETERQVDATAQEASVLVWIGDALIRQFLTDEPDFARSLLASLANQLRAALDRIDIARHGKAEARLAAALVVMARDAAGDRIICTQQELADFIGVSRVRLGTLLAMFSQNGLVRRGYGTIEIIDRESLQALYAS